jgi:hypothetical protein
MQKPIITAEGIKESVTVWLFIKDSIAFTKNWVP